ncbi:unnamed protein product [Chrysoparadoxa australica]
MRRTIALSLTLLPLLVSTFAFLPLTMAVDRKKFRTCESTGFCKRNRPPPKAPLFQLDPTSISAGADGITGSITQTPGDPTPLELEIKLYTSGSCRLRVTETTYQRWQPRDVLIEDGAGMIPAPYRLLLETSEGIPTWAKKELADGAGMAVSYGEEGQEEGFLSVRFNPFEAKIWNAVTGEVAVQVNPQQMMHFEKKRDREATAREMKEADNEAHVKQEDGGKTVLDYWEDGRAIYSDGTRETREEYDARVGHNHQVVGEGMWEESFDGHSDTKPDGPVSVGVDVSFPGSSHLYGIPEHATSMKLKGTAGVGAPYSEPYRLYALDVFEYELDEPMALYGTIPLLVSHKTGQTAAVFWFNPTETFVDIQQGSPAAHWISEGGPLDLFLLPGPNPADVFRQYAHLTGFPELPPSFALGFHQCRWNYRDEQDVLEVEAKFEELDFPVDVIWLDIEHTEGKRYFTWDKRLFPDPIGMQEKLAAHGRKVVTIIDPHIKRDSAYAIHKEASAKGLYVKDRDGKDFDGWCWPGSSSYLDFTDPAVRRWWAERLSIENYEGSTLNLYVWNDMNEPSVFNGPEVSMRKDCKSLAGVEHRDWHNLYGMYMQRATAEGLVMRSPEANARPFVLSRSFYAGSQRWGAIWTGDNTATWEHLAAATPMLLSMGIAGLPFVGADVGGFFGEPDAELFLRWMQAGAYQPFFRSHAHHDSKRREPWVFGDPWTQRLRAAVMARYALLPYWYTSFQSSSTTGMPIMRPMWVQFPEDEKVFGIDDQWMAGSDLLIKPITTRGSTSTQVYFPSGRWYDVSSYELIQPGGAAGQGQALSVNAPIDHIPVYQRGGSIVPRQERLRRSASVMKGDPYTLVVALDDAHTATGQLYIDDEVSFDYKLPGGASFNNFWYKSGTLSSSGASGYPGGLVERVIVLGLTREPTAVSLGGKALSFVWDKTGSWGQGGGVLTIKQPHVPVTSDFKITIT